MPQTKSQRSTKEWIYLEEPIEGANVVEFRLVYSGRLLGASRGDTRAEMKHAMRREFHPQLRRLWEINSSLKEMTKRLGWSNLSTDSASLPEFPDEDVPEWNRLGLELMAKKWSRNGYRFIPLVTEELAVRCSVNILFLRPDEPGFLLEMGDIDSRVKTIFDALRMPKNLDEAGGKGPQDDEDPFYCLLEDDKLISEIRVETDQLLLLPKERQLNANDAFLVLHVRTKVIKKHDSRWAWVFE